VLGTDMNGLFAKKWDAAPVDFFQKQCEDDERHDHAEHVG